MRTLVAAGRLRVGPWMHPDGRVRRLAGDDRPEPGGRPAAAVRARRHRRRPPVGYGPDVFGHVAQLPQLLRLPGSTTPWCGGVCRPPWATSPPPSGGRPPTVRRCGPSTSTAPTPTGRDIPTGPAPGRAGPGLRGRGRFAASRRVMLLMNGGDHRPPESWVTAPWPRRNAAEGRYGFEVTLAAGWRRRARRADGARHSGGASCARRRRRRAVGSGFQPGRCARAAAAAERASNGRRNRCWPCSAPADYPEPRCSTSPGTGSSPTAPTTPPAPAAPTPSPTGAGPLCRGRARSATPSPTRRWPIWPPRPSTVPPRSPSSSTPPPPPGPACR